jgi:hypothetical protein
VQELVSGREESIAKRVAPLNVKLPTNVIYLRLCIGVSVEVDTIYGIYQRERKVKNVFACADLTDSLTDST